MPHNKIITRFAPSPTGELHIGGARTALFAYLASKSTDGKFLLRIEDTDRERFVEGATERIIDSLKWLKLTPQNLENIIVQSQRLNIYQDLAHKLVKEGKAYICTCSKEKLDEERKVQEEAKKPTGYLGTCRELNIKFSDVKEGEYVIRMKMPKSGKFKIQDLIRGEVEFDLSLIDDQVILKSDGYPTYYLAAAVDDNEMGVTDVFRGEEWLSSTPKSVVLTEMLEFKPIIYAHLPMVLAPDRTKLSKRHGATSVTDYKQLGYLPEAIINFLVLQGWSPKDNREFFTLAELEKEFKIENINKAPAIFDINKLNYINEHYLRAKNYEDLKNLLKDFDVDNLTEAEAEIIKRGGYATLKIAADYILALRKTPEYDSNILIFKKSDKATTLKALELVIDKISDAEWDSDFLQKTLENLVVENNLTNGDVFWPVRVALSGQEKSPSPVELLIALGKVESLSRIKTAINMLQSK